jgi:predicted dithiol-disulfide oxidoreductase (DUF899 family)
MKNTVASHEAWLAARRELLDAEKALTHQREALRAGAWNFDYRVSFSPQEAAAGTADYNFHEGRIGAEEAGISVFARDGAELFHAYSCYARGTEMLNPVYHYLDLVPKGRDEGGLNFTMAWVRRHDQYED